MLLRRGEIHKGELEVDGRVEKVEEIAPSVKDGAFILVLRQLIVDVQKLNGLGILPVRHLADAVLVHPLVGNGLLCGNALFACLLGAGDGSFYFLLFSPGQFSCGAGRIALLLVFGQCV